MNLGPYAVTFEGPASLLINAVDSFRINLFGIPRGEGETPAEIAKAALRHNARGVLHAGSGHFCYMWPSDFAKALRGAWDVLGPEYLGGLIDYMTLESGRLGKVTSCFTPRHGFDMPWYRGDNLPWLVDSSALRAARTGRPLKEAHRLILQRLLDSYEASHFENGLLSRSITGDWVDTIMRPSSTYNNVCVLHMLRLAPALGLTVRTDAQAFEKRLLEDRWRGDHFTDYAGAEVFSVDSAVVALYLELFDAPLREKLIAGLEKSGLAEPYPIRCAPHEHDPRLMPFLTKNFSPQYHSSIWLHLGLMYLNGLKKAGRDVSARRAAVEALTMDYGQMLESIDGEGKPFRTLFFSCEYGLSMAAGQYLELAGRTIEEGGAVTA